MDVQTVVIDPEIALTKLREFRSVAVANRRKEDNAFRRLYRSASKGNPILDVLSAFKATGLNEKGQPKLAIARANWKEVFYNTYWNQFQEHRWVKRGKVHAIPMPNGIFDGRAKGKDLVSTVPFIPPTLRPKTDLENYHILFEVKDWEEYPADPFLLKQISGWLFVVVGEWELTDLERSLLSNI